MLRAVSMFLLMTPLAVMQEEGGKPAQAQMQVRKEADVKYLPKEEGQHLHFNLSFNMRVNFEMSFKTLLKVTHTSNHFRTKLFTKFMYCLGLKPFKQKPTNKQKPWK